MGGNGIRASDPVSGPVAHGPASSSRLPVVLSVAEVQALLSQLRGVHYLICALLYGTGMRLLECLSLRVRDLDFDRHAIHIRAAKGQKDRTVALPERLAPQLRDHLAGVHALHQEDLAAGYVLRPALMHQCPLTASHATARAHAEGRSAGERTGPVSRRVGTSPWYPGEGLDPSLLIRDLSASPPGGWRPGDHVNATGPVLMYSRSRSS